MKERKYKELVKLKGLLREKKVSYAEISNVIKMNISTFSDKINGYKIFNLIEINAIKIFLEIPEQEIPFYFF